jgi:hypothetical protein
MEQPVTSPSLEPEESNPNIVTLPETSPWLKVQIWICSIIIISNAFWYDEYLTKYEESNLWVMQCGVCNAISFASVRLYLK